MKSIIFLVKKEKKKYNPNGATDQTLLLGSKTLGTNILELHFVLCWQTMIKT